MSRTPEQKPRTAALLAGWHRAMSRQSSGVTYRQAALALGVAAILGIVQSAPMIGATAQVGVWASAVRGTAALMHRAGYGATTLADYLAAFFWKIGAAQGLAIWQSLLVFLLAAFFSLCTLALVGWVAGFFPRWRQHLLSVVGVLLLLWSGYSAWTGFSHRPALTAALVLSQPVELAADISTQKAGTVFASPTAVSYLLLTNPSATGDLTPEDAATLARKPRQWREALRTAPWHAVLLAGPISEYHGLLDHLLISPDWRLAKISNLGFLFLREEGSPVASLDPTTVKIGSPRDNALYLAQIAEMYEAVRRTAEARSLSKIAIDAAPNDVEVLSHTAALEANRGKWYDAIAYCDRALKIEPSSTYLLLLKASCLLEINQADKADRIARQVLDRAPNDLYTLFLYARISRAVHDATSESETLEKLIKLTPPDVIPVNYYVFLGQAYAKLGQPELAIGAYRKALTRPDMGPQLGAEIRNQIQNIEQKGR
jgi:tetratricopeptide (TPR) repeat protein